MTNKNVFLPSQCTQALNEYLQAKLQDFGGVKPHVQSATAIIYGKTADEAFLFSEVYFDKGSNYPVVAICVPLPSYSIATKVSSGKTFVNWEWRHNSGLDREEVIDQANRTGRAGLLEFFTHLASFCEYDGDVRPALDSLRTELSKEDVEKELFDLKNRLG